MVDRGYDMLDAISKHSEAFAAAAEGNFGTTVEHCPAWTVADLVWHLTEVHWFWGTIVEERLEAPPDESRGPERSPDAELLGAFRAGADRLVHVLGAADGSAHVWTWAPAQQDVAFVTRHQVQEAAVHHWDACHAAGDPLVVEPLVASDAVDEFLTFSVSSDADPADPARPALDGSLVLRCTDTESTWRVTDGGTPGTIASTRRAAGPAGTTHGTPELAASASDLLLWLYGRVALDIDEGSEELVARFRALTFTD